MDVIVGNVSGDHEIDRRDMQASAIDGIRMAYVADDQLLPLQKQRIAVEPVGQNDVLGDQAWKPLVPERRHDLRRHLFTHDLENLGRCDSSRAGKPLQQDAIPEEVVAMTVCRVDRRQVLSALFDPVRKCVRLGDRRERIHQNCVPLAINENRRSR